MLLSPVLRNQRQVNLFEFEAILVHTVISRTARTTQRNSVSNKQTNNSSRISYCVEYILKLYKLYLLPHKFLSKLRISIPLRVAR